MKDESPCCSVLLPAAVVNTQKQLVLGGEGGFISVNTLQAILREAWVGPQARVPHDHHPQQELKQRLWTGASCLLASSCPACFLLQPSITCPRVAPLTVGWVLPLQSLPNIIHRRARRLDLGRQFLNWGSLSPVTLASVKLTKTDHRSSNLTLWNTKASNKIKHKRPVDYRYKNTSWNINMYYISHIQYTYISYISYI